MKRRWVALIAVLSVIIGMVAGAALFYFSTAGRLYRADGLLQNSRMRIENVYFDGGLFTYTIVNDSCKDIRCDDSPYIERREGDQWITLDKKEHFDSETVYVPFRRVTHFLTWEALIEQLTLTDADGILLPEEIVGEYRIVEGKVNTSAHNNLPKYREDVPYLVGYFTVTEDMIPS